MRVPWTAGRSNQLILKGISSEYSLEGLMLKLKLQYFDHLMQRTDSLEKKTLMLGNIEGRRRRRQQRMRWLAGITNSWSPHIFMFFGLVTPSNCLIFCHPLLLLPSILPNIRAFSNESALCIRWLSTGVSASASVLPVNIQDSFPLGWTGCISFQSKGHSRVFSNTTVQKHQFFGAQLSL